MSGGASCRGDETAAGSPEASLAALLRALSGNLRAALRDVDEAVDGIGDAFERLDAIRANATVADAAAAAREQARIVRALQFQDRLQQRVSRVCDGLDAVSERLGRGDGGGDAGDWRALARRLGAGCPVQADEALYRQAAEAPAPRAPGSDTGAVSGGGA